MEVNWGVGMNMLYAVLTTTDSEEIAERITRTLLEKRLAACIQRTKVTSSYWWKGKIEESKEVLLIIKTSSEKYPELEREIKKIHNYTVPEIVALELKEIQEDYENWLLETLSQK